MGYRIIVKDPTYQRRGEAWDRINYPTREKAEKEIKKAKKAYKNTAFKHQQFKIVKTQKVISPQMSYINRINKIFG